MPAYELQLPGEGTEPSDWSYHVLSYCTGWCGRRLPFRGVRSPWDGLSALVLTTQVLGGSDLLRRSPPLPG
jgi:hypothetical protein